MRAGFTHLDFELAYLAAFTALRFLPPDDIAQRLARATPSGEVLLEVVAAMRMASPLGVPAPSKRMAAAISVLAKYERKGSTSQ
jgi:hypothetical protein